MSATNLPNPDASYLSSALSALGVERFHRAGDVIYRRGDPSDGIIVIRNGLVRAEQIDNPADRHSIAFAGQWGPGEAIGVLGVYYDAPRRRTTYAVVDTVAVHVGAELVHRARRSDPRLALAIAQESARRSVQLNESALAPMHRRSDLKRQLSGCTS